MYNYISKLKKSTNYYSKIITFDIQTIFFENEYKAYSIAWFDGVFKRFENILFYREYQSLTLQSYQIIQKFLSCTLIKKNENASFYCQNYFDIVIYFILDNLVLCSKVEPLIKDGKIIYVTTVLAGKKYYFKNSCKLYAPPLNLNNQYKSSFKNTELWGWNNFANQNAIFSLKREQPLKLISNKNMLLRKTVLISLLVLYEVLIKSSKLIFNCYGINLLKRISVSDLALNLFRVVFNNAHPQIYRGSYETEKIIRKGYTGSLVNNLKPIGENIFAYDLNSQYAAAMLNYMPVGKPRMITNKINLKKFYGFLVVKAILIPNTKITILKLDKEKHQVFFSEELKAAILSGYRFKVYKALQFRKKKIFNKFVNHFYLIKTNNLLYPEDNFVSKLILVTLYGRFGLLPRATSTQIPNAAVHISSAVTAFARINLIRYKYSQIFFLIYSDADTLFLSKPIHKNLINNNLGFMKKIFFNKKILWGIFPGHKIYCLRTYSPQLQELLDVVKASGLKEIVLESETFFSFLSNKKITVTNLLNYKIIKNLKVYYKIINFNYDVTMLKQKKIFNSKFKWIDIL